MGINEDSKQDTVSTHNKVCGNVAKNNLFYASAISVHLFCCSYSLKGYFFF